MEYNFFPNYDHPLEKIAKEKNGNYQSLLNGGWVPPYFLLKPSLRHVSTETAQNMLRLRLGRDCHHTLWVASVLIYQQQQNIDWRHIALPCLPRPACCLVYCWMQHHKPLECCIKPGIFHLMNCQRLYVGVRWTVKYQRGGGTPNTQPQHWWVVVKVHMKYIRGGVTGNKWRISQLGSTPPPLI